MLEADLLAIDIDFTLVDENRAIPEKNRQAVRQAVDAGVHVVLASGRMASGVRDIARQLGLTAPYVSSNGAFVADSKGSVLEEHSLPIRVVPAVVEHCREHGHHANVYAFDRVHFAERTRQVDEYLAWATYADPVQVEWVELGRLPATKIIVLDERERLISLREVSSTLVDPADAHVTFSEPNFLEFLCTSCDKGTGVRVVADHLGIPQARVAAIGDFDNDIPMLEWAGKSAVVANGSDAAKGAADFVVGSHADGGVAEFISILLQN